MSDVFGSTHRELPLSRASGADRVQQSHPLVELGVLERGVEDGLVDRAEARYWGCSRRMRRGAIEWTFIGWTEMRA
jgi:hypothetical protein